MDPVFRGVSVVAFERDVGSDPEASRGPGPVRLHAAAGDRVTVLTGDILLARPEEAVARALRHDTFAERVRALADDGPPLDRDRWALLEIDFGGTER